MIKKIPIYFCTNVACSACFLEVISASDLANLSVSLLMKYTFCGENRRSQRQWT